MSIDLEIMVF